MVKQLREISIAVEDLGQAIEDFRRKLGIEPSEVQVHPSPPIQCRAATFRIGDACLALMESTAAGSPIDRFIKARGEGVFSVSVSVSDMDEATRRLRQNGVELVLNAPLRFEEYRAFDKKYSLVKMNFTRPGSLHGVVFEIQELVD